MVRYFRLILPLCFLIALMLQSCGAVQPERVSPPPDAEYARQGLKSAGLLGTVPTVCAEDVAVYGTYVYVADGPTGISVINAKDPTKLSVIRTMSSTYAYRLYVYQDHLYLCDGPGGICVYSLTKPSEPALTYSCQTKWASGLAFNNGYMYLADYYDGVKIFQLSDPAQPVLLAANIPSRARDVYIDGTTLAVADAVFGLVTYILNAPTQALWTYIDSSRFANFEDVVIYNGYSIIARNDESSSIAIFHTLDPMHVELADELHPTRFVSGIARFGKVLFAACGEEGVLAFDLTDMADIRLLWVVNTAGFAQHVKVVGNRLYVADMSRLCIYDITGMGGDWS